MNKRWLANLSHEEKEDLRVRIAHNRDLFQILDKLLREELESVQNSRRSLKSYVTQNWSEFQADRNATERTLIEVLELLPIKD